VGGLGGAEKRSPKLILMISYPASFSNQINLSRKTKQEEVAPRLSNLTRKRDEILYTNLELQKACAMLRMEIKRLRTDVASEAALEGHEKNGNEVKKDAL
jgi:hypothetical protein